MNGDALVKSTTKIMFGDAGISGTAQYMSQLIWILFLKVFDAKEGEWELKKGYVPIIPEGFRFRDWADIRKNDGAKDLANRLTGEKLIQFVNNTLFPFLQGKLTKQLENYSSVDSLLKNIADEKLKLIEEGKIKKEKPFAEITEDEILSDIPDNWRWERIGNLFIHAAGKALNQLKEKEGKLLPYITTSNLYWDCFKLDNLKQMYFTDSELEKCTAKKGDLLVCEGGDVGRSAIWDKDYNICLQNHIHKLRPYSIEINVRFYFYYLMLLKLTGEVKDKGIGLKGLSAGALNTMVIPLPPVEEQNRVVEKLNIILPIIDSMAVYGTKKKVGRPKQEEALAFINSFLGTKKSAESKPVSPEILELTAKAKEELPTVVKKYAELMGVTYNRITIRHQKTRWGSCTKTGNLNFNCLLMKMPENVRDYVIVHELAHRKEMNHSAKFWAIVTENCSGYKDAKKWLKDNDQKLMER